MKPNSLDYWREYFRTANCDVFDIIEGAIMVAASDCPLEFKLQRDRIAERLFSCRFVQCSGCERVELAVPSDEAVVDHNDDDGLMKSGIAGDGDEQGGSKGIKVNSTGRVDHRDLAMNRESIYSFEEAEALPDEIEEESRILEEVSRINEILMNYEEESESVLFEYLRRLQLMGLTVGMLKGTGIGIAVNLMRKHRSKQISRLSQALISLWKSMVDEWMCTTQDMPGGTPDSVNPSTVVDEEDDEEEGLPSPLLEEGAFLAAEPTPMELSRFFDGMDDSGNTRNSGGLPNKCVSGSKSSLHNLSRNGVDQRIEKRRIETKIQVRNEKPVPLRKESPVVKLNRAVNGNPERVRELNPQPRRLEKPAITTQRRSLGNQQDDSKCIDKEAAVQIKLEATKRKLHESYQQVENVKKQRTIQVMELQDLPKQAGVNHRNPQGRPGNQNKPWDNGRR